MKEGPGNPAYQVPKERQSQGTSESLALQDSKSQRGKSQVACYLGPFSGSGVVWSAAFLQIGYAHFLSLKYIYYYFYYYYY